MIPLPPFVWRALAAVAVLAVAFVGGYRHGISTERGAAAIRAQAAAAAVAEANTRQAERLRQIAAQAAQERSDDLSQAAAVADGLRRRLAADRLRCGTAAAAGPALPDVRPVPAAAAAGSGADGSGTQEPDGALIDHAAADAANYAACYRAFNRLRDAAIAAGAGDP